MRCLHMPLLRSSETSRFQQETIVFLLSFLGNNSFKQSIYDQLQLLDRFFFFLILRIMAQKKKKKKNYGSDGILSPSLLNQMIRKRLKLFKQSFCVGASEYASHME